ncbi:CAP domain-containing protein [Phyllosticta citriasiana]|uniref:CAP domain-containing protein n=1 Tax=Phyllosticta citriasiana TaxID=595635 RepID=A0ABR1L3X8_9PEZI
MKVAALLSVLFSTSALAGVIQPRQDDSMSGGEEQPTSQDPTAARGAAGGGAFKFASFCKASGSATQNPQDPMAKQLMAYHNVHRTFHGACSLLYDPALAKTAQAAANTCKFQHQMTGDNGQNVAEQSASGDIAAGTVFMWYEEGSKTNYQGGNMEQGHYTQVLWKGTYALGCGVKNCGQMTLVFCNYAPAGNMIGAFEQSVGNRVPNARPICAEQQAMSQYSNGRRRHWHRNRRRWRQWYQDEEGPGWIARHPAEWRRRRH